MLMSESPHENEWLLPPGAEFEVGKIYPKLITKDDKEIKVDE